MNPKVSICIPSYNHARFLPAAIESALAQTYRNIEIIIVDDGSSDDSLQIAQGYAVKYPTIISVFSHPNHQNLGISATINLALKEAKGDYWSLLGSDDVLYPDKTARQISFLNQHPECSWVYGKAHVIDKHGNILPEVNRIDISRELNPLESLVVSNPITAITVLAGRGCLEGIGEHNEDLVYSDWEFWIRMAAHYRVGFVASPLVQYRVHGYNTSIGIEKKEQVKRKLAVLNSLRTNASNYGGQLTTPMIQALIELRRSQFLFYLGEEQSAAESLRRIFYIWPSILQEPKRLDRWLTFTYESPSFYRWMSENLPEDLESWFRRRTTKLLAGLMFARAATESYQSGDFRTARGLAIRAQITDQRWLSNRILVSLLLETIVGSSAMNFARQLGRRALLEGR